MKLGTEAFRRDPYPWYRILRAQGEAIWDEDLQVWLVPGYASSVELLSDPRVRKANADGDLTGRAAESAVLRMRSMWILMREGDFHRRIRPILSRAVSRSAVAALTPAIEQECTDLVKNVADRTEFDFVSEVAAPLPFRVVSRLLDIPRAHDDSLRLASAALFRTLEPGVTPRQWEAAEKSATWLTALFTRHLARDQFTEGGVAASIAAALARGELTVDEAAATCTLMFVAGHETTTHFLGNAVLALSRHPDLRSAVAEWTPSTNTVDELWRYDTSIQTTHRVAGTDLEVGDTVIPAGSPILFLLGSANRDDRTYAAPDTLDFHRDRRQHLGFGFGAHFCLGAQLARVEAACLLRALYEQGSGWNVDQDSVDWSGAATVRGPRRVVLRTR